MVGVKWAGPKKHGCFFHWTDTEYKKRTQSTQNSWQLQKLLEVEAAVRISFFLHRLTWLHVHDNGHWTASERWQQLSRREKHLWLQQLGKSEGNEAKHGVSVSAKGCAETSWQCTCAWWCVVNTPPPPLLSTAGQFLSAIVEHTYCPDLPHQLLSVIGVVLGGFSQRIEIRCFCGVMPLVWKKILNWPVAKPGSCSVSLQSHSWCDNQMFVRKDFPGTTRQRHTSVKRPVRNALKTNNGAALSDVSFSTEGDPRGPAGENKDTNVSQLTGISSTDFLPAWGHSTFLFFFFCLEYTVSY